MTSRDLVATAEAALAQGVSVALVEQPYRVAGRRSPSPAHMLDTAWIAVLERLRSDVVGDVALVVGGRSSGARVACRTSEVTGPPASSALPSARPPSRGRLFRRRGSRSSMPFACPRSWSRANATRSECSRLDAATGGHGVRRSQPESDLPCGRSRRPGLAAPPRGIAGGARRLRPPDVMPRPGLHHTNRSMDSPAVRRGRW